MYVHALRGTISQPSRRVVYYVLRYLILCVNLETTVPRVLVRHFSGYFCESVFK